MKAVLVVVAMIMATQAVSARAQERDLVVCSEKFVTFSGILTADAKAIARTAIYTIRKSDIATLFSIPLENPDAPSISGVVRGAQLHE